MIILNKNSKKTVYIDSNRNKNTVKPRLRTNRSATTARTKKIPEALARISKFLGSKVNADLDVKL